MQRGLSVLFLDYQFSAADRMTSIYPAFSVNSIPEGYHYIGPTNDTSTYNTTLSPSLSLTCPIFSLAIATQNACMRLFSYLRMQRYLTP